MRSCRRILAGILSISAATTIHTSADGFLSLSRSFTSFLTEPTFHAERFKVAVLPSEQGQLAPGYLFLDPYVGRQDFGPQIYTVDGALVWHGPARRRTQNFHVCDYAGHAGSHLCYTERRRGRPLPKHLYPGKQGRPSSRYAWHLILNDSYAHVRDPFKEGFDGLPLNPHAFESVDSGKSFVTLVNRPKRINLVPYGGSKWGWVKDQCFEEIDFQTRHSVFRWCFLDSGLPIWSTNVFFTPSWQHWWSFGTSPNHTTEAVGTGDVSRTWDFLHINAVTKNAHGNYYLSVRHADMILCIAGPNNKQGVQPGTILWKLGGKLNDFKLIGFMSDTAPFSKQHDVRPVMLSGNEEVISLFNNAFEGNIAASQPYSDAQIIRINIETKQAKLEHSFPHPGRKLTPGRGSAQVLENGNVFVSWGDLGELTEFNSNGTILYQATFEQAGLPLEEHEFTYRAYKFPWVGKPLSDPRLVVQYLACNSTILKDFSKPVLVAYVSWNGATEVHSWRLSVSTKPNGKWTTVGTFQKKGFETQIYLTDTTIVAKALLSELNVRVEAVNNKGLSSATATAIPELAVDWDCSQRKLQAKVVLLIFYITIESTILIWHFVLYSNK